MSTNPPFYTYGHTQFVEYNSQVMSFPQVTMSGRTRFDETGRSIIGYDLTFRVNCMFICNNVAPVAPDQTDSRNADFIAQLRVFLSKIGEPGKFFRWYTLPPSAALPTAGAAVDMTNNWKGRVFVIAPSPEVTTGAANPVDATHYDKTYGPKPRVVDWQTITAGKSARVAWQLDTFVTITDSDPISATLTPNADILEFWQEYNFAFDRNFICTRTVTGKYKLRSPLNAATIFLANAIFMPPLPQYFYRESINHRLNKDGTEITFAVVDHEIWRTLPKPITDGYATFRVEQQGAHCIKSLAGSFSAPTDVDKACIIQFIYCLIRYRFPNFKGASMGTGSGDWIRQFTLVNHEFENRVDFTVTGQSIAALNAASSTGTADLIPMMLDDIYGMEAVWKDGAAAPSIHTTALLSASEIAANGGNKLWGFDGGNMESRAWMGTVNAIGAIAPVAKLDPKTAGTAVVSPSPVQAAGLSPQSPPDVSSNLPGTATGPKTTTHQIFSDSHLTCPYITYIETWHYILLRHQVLMKSSSVGGTDFIQVPSKPTLKIIQVGSARRIGFMPNIPQPAFTDMQDSEYVTRQEIKTYPIEVSADGVTPVYKLGWTYEVVVPGVNGLNYTKAKLTDLTRAYPPADPRFSRKAAGDAGNFLDNKTARDGASNDDTDGKLITIADADGKATLTRTPAP